MYTYRIGIDPVRGLVGLGRACVALLGPDALHETVTATQLRHRVVLQCQRTGRYRIGPRRFRESDEVIVVARPFRWRGVWGQPRSIPDLGEDV